MRRQPFGDADHGADAGVDGLVDGVGGKTGWNEDHRRVRARLRDRLGHGVEDRDALDVLPALPRRHARDDIGAVIPVANAVEGSLAPGQALHDEERVAIDDDRHYVLPLSATRVSTM